MHIAVDARYLGAVNSGLARYSEHLLEALARLDASNRYTVYVNAGLSRRLKLGDNFRIVPMRGWPNSLASMLRLARAVRRDAPDLLHVHFPLAPMLVDCPVMLTVHDMLPFVREGTAYGLRFRPFNLMWSYLLYPMALARAKWAICVSHATRQSLAELFPATFQKTVAVHSGLNENFRIPMEPSTVDLIRSRLELPADYLLYSGSTRSEKNVDGMLLAFARLRQRNPGLENLHFVLDLAGDEGHTAPLRKLIRQFGLEGRVRIIRNAGDEERRVIFGDARLLLILSRYEGFGFPILEAQMCDLPVLAADSGALPEIAGEQGAVFVDPDNMEQVVAMLERVLDDEDLREFLVEHGRANVARFDWNRTAEQIRQIYELLFYPREQIAVPHRRIPLPFFH